jgi:hypothetical protein
LQLATLHRLGIPNRPLLLHAARPRDYDVGTPVLFVHQGVGRNGRDYRDYWLSLVDAQNRTGSFPAYGSHLGCLALDLIRRLLAGEAVSSARRFRIAGASLALRPAEPVEVWIGASAPPAIDRAARLAEGWIASPGLTLEEARSQADIYRERCAAYGRQPSAIALRRDIYVGQSSDEAQAVLQHALSQGYRGIPAEALIAGSVDEVAEQFRTFDAIGYTEILVRHLTNDQPKVLGSLERLAAVRAALAES